MRETEINDNLISARNRKTGIAFGYEAEKGDYMSQRNGVQTGLLLVVLVLCSMLLGKTFSIEASEVQLQYRSYVEKQGWGPMVTSGITGSEGKALRMEAIKIHVLPKGSEAPGSDLNAFYAKYK